MQLKYNTESFIARANEVHKGNYTYENVEYVKSTAKVSITCKVHGTFEQSPANHLNGRGCRKCAKRALSSKPKPVNDYLQEVNKVHDNFYTYDLTGYKSLGSRIVVICPVHGAYETVAGNHLRGATCPKCGQERATEKFRGNKEGFVKKSREIHGDKYTYDKVVYVTARKPVIITCPVHGDFLQTPDNHQKGCGCTGCTKGEYNQTLPTILYYLKVNNGDQYKIGITAKNTVEERFSLTELEKIEILLKVLFPTGKEAYDVEQKLLSVFSSYKYKGAPILISGNSELFTENVLKDYLDSELDYKTLANIAEDLLIRQSMLRLPNNATLEEVQQVMDKLDE